MTKARYSSGDMPLRRLRNLHEVETRHRELFELLRDPPPSYDEEALSELSGAAAALGWVAGLVVEAPVSGAVVIQPLHPEAIWGEFDVAERVSLPNAYPDYSPPAKAVSCDRDYVLGARDALRWVFADDL